MLTVISLSTEVKSTAQLQVRVHFKLILEYEFCSYWRPYCDCEMQNSNKNAI